MPSTWSTPGSLPSDRLQPKRSTPPPRQQGKGRGKASTPEPPKSRTVRILESRLRGVRETSGPIKDPKGGCFCQAREHDLSSYVPICRQCGLILCTLNPPYYACPHCGNSLLDESQRAALIVQLEDELGEQLAREETERQRVIDEARAAEGEFPVLAGSQPQRIQMSVATPQATRTVLSLNSQTKKVMVSSYTSTPASSRPVSRGDGGDVLQDGERRVPAPPKGVSCVKEPRDPSRPWRNMRAGDVRYVPPPVEKSRGAEGGSTSRRRRKGGERTK